MYLPSVLFPSVFFPPQIFLLSFSWTHRCSLLFPHHWPYAATQLLCAARFVQFFLLVENYYGVVPYWFTFAPNTHHIFVFLRGFKNFLMSYRKILATLSTQVNPAQNQVEVLCRAPFGGRESDNLSAMLGTLSPPAPCTNNNAGFAFLCTCRHIACLTALVAQLSFDSDPLFLPHSLLLGRTLMPIIALWYTREAGESTLC